ADRNRSHWSTSKTPSYTKSVSWQHHRVIDGAAGAAFLRELKRLIETPTLMFIQETSYAR
ncbi:2-oxo acid dehydrogenase subunit E2, partial [Klebsiella pneumoniae]|uniref:2-oxo acid dehydrogenase subunit E2 n=1 Tax=Klebsiella pneumoniae TaxID=573 RepID=UPI00298BF669